MEIHGRRCPLLSCSLGKFYTPSKLVLLLLLQLLLLLSLYRRMVTTLVSLVLTTLVVELLFLRVEPNERFLDLPRVPVLV